MPYLFLPEKIGHNIIGVDRSLGLELPLLTPGQTEQAPYLPLISSRLLTTNVTGGSSPEDGANNPAMISSVITTSSAFKLTLLQLRLVTKSSYEDKEREFSYKGGHRLKANFWNANIIDISEKSTVMRWKNKGSMKSSFSAPEKLNQGLEAEHVIHIWKSVTMTCVI